MMKKLLALLLPLMLCAASASATILPATGVDEAFKAWTGIDCTPAVVLCESLSVLDNRGDQGGKKVETLYYSGKTVPVIESWDGYAKIYYADGTKTGWVRNDYLMMDPAWYLCDRAVQVYAYPDTMAPRVALMDEGAKLPILTQWDDAGLNGWVCVSLRGAAGWLRKTPQDTAAQTGFRPQMLADISGAELQYGDQTVSCADPAIMAQLATLLTHVEDKGGPMAGCPFTATLSLSLADGQRVSLQLATDSCCVYRINNRDYAYARTLFDPNEGNPDNAVLFSLFGLRVDDGWAR